MTLSQQLAALGLDDVRTALTRAETSRVFTETHKTQLDGAISARVSALISSGRRVDATIIADEERARLNAELLTAARAHTHAAHSAVASLRPKLDQLRRTARGPAPLPPALSTEEQSKFIRSDAMNFEVQRLILRELRGLRLRHDLAPLSIEQKLAALEDAEQAKDAEVTNYLEPVIQRELAAIVTRPGVDPQDTIDAHKALVGRLERIRDARLSEDDRKALAEAEAAVATLEREAKSDDQLWRAIEHTRTIVPQSTEYVNA